MLDQHHLCNKAKNAGICQHLVCINRIGQLWVVFYSTAQVDGVSLNNVLLTGPDLKEQPVWSFGIHCSSEDSRKIAPQRTYLPGTRVGQPLARGNVCGLEKMCAVAAGTWRTTCSPNLCIPLYILSLRQRNTWFSDASVKAIARVAYLRTVQENRYSEIRFFFGKAGTLAWTYHN